MSREPGYARGLMIKYLRWHPGRTVYAYGIYPCIVVEDFGTSIRYIPQTGYAKHQKGKEFTAAKDFFTENYYGKAKRVVRTSDC